MTADAFDLGDFEDDATPTPQAIGVMATDPDADELGDDDLSKTFWDMASADVALSVLGETSPERAAEIVGAAKIVAMDQKPTLAEMIEAVNDAAYRLEGSQERLLICGIRTEPHAPYIRQVVVFDALSRFLSLIQSKQAAVGRVLRGK